ncbi:MAG: hypothetical protein ABI682_16635 [Acidobacteriota bacterium]
MKIGERVLLPKVGGSSDETLVVADGFYCREQIRQSTGREALHPAQVLQMAIRADSETASRGGAPSASRA